MNFLALRPVLYTKQIRETVEFYCENLGFTCIEHHQNWQLAFIRRESIELMLAYPNEHIPFLSPKLTGSLYFTVCELDELWITLKDNCSICYPLESFDWGMREFAIYDNNGYLLQFGEEIEITE